MKRFLFPLLATIALPAAVNAESYWLLIRSMSGQARAMEKIEMGSIAQCEKEINKLLIRWDMKEKHGQDQFACVTGK